MEFDHTESAIIRTHEVGQDKKLTVPSLLMLMQEASMQNVLKLKASVWDMEKDLISWVLLRKELEIIRRPYLGERIQTLTYPAGFNRVFAYRDYIMRDDEGQILAKAGSTWTLLHTLTRKMVRIPSEFYSLMSGNRDEFLPKPGNKIDELQTPKLKKEYEIGFFDLDWNGHVNNNVLSRLILQSLPEEYLRFMELQSFTFHIKSECFLGERLEIQFEKVNEQVSRHAIFDKNHSRKIASAVGTWKAK